MAVPEGGEGVSYEQGIPVTRGHSCGVRICGVYPHTQTMAHTHTDPGHTHFLSVQGYIAYKKTHPPRTLP